MKISEGNRADPASGVPRWLALGAVAGPIFFVLAYIILGFLRPGYSLVSEPVSGLGVGPNALVMNTSFVLMGVLIAIGLIGIFLNMKELGGATRWICIVLLGLSPIGCIFCGIFTYETFFLHFLGFLLACGTPVICFLVVGLMLLRVQSYRRFGNWLLIGSPLTVILIYLFFNTFDYLTTDVGTAGLIERFLIIEIQAFYVALGWLVFRIRIQ